MSRYRPGRIGLLAGRQVGERHEQVARSAGPSSTNAPRLIGWPWSVNSSTPTRCICRSVPVDVGISNTGRSSASCSAAGDGVGRIGRVVAQRQQRVALVRRESGSSGSSRNALVLDRARVRRSRFDVRLRSSGAGGPDEQAAASAATTASDDESQSNDADASTKGYTRRCATAASASARRSATVLTGADLQHAAQRGQQRAQRVALGHRRERAPRRRLDALRRVVDEDARGRLVQRRLRMARRPSPAARASTALSAA